jgi:hypothetical protein
MLDFREDRYWRSNGSLCPDLDLVISEILLHNPTITALTITIKVRHAYNFVMVLGGWPCDTLRSWWSAEWTDIGGVTGHYVLTWTW